MRCSKVRKLLPCYMDLELDDDLAMEVKGHLEVCESCAAELRAQEQVLKVLAVWDTPEPKRDYSDFIMSVNAEKETASQKRIIALLPVPAWAAAVLALASIVVGGISGINWDVPEKPVPTHKQVMAAMGLTSFNDVLDASLANWQAGGGERGGAE